MIDRRPDLQIGLAGRGVVGCGIRLNCISPNIVIPAQAGIPLFSNSETPACGGDGLGKPAVLLPSHRSSLLKLLDERGYIHQVTDAAALDALAGKEW